MHIGKQSIVLHHPVYINSVASIVGTKEGEGPLGYLFDEILKDDLAGCESWETAESFLQKKALETAMQKAHLKSDDIQLLLAGDLLGQSIASSFSTATFPIPHIGVYGACSTCALTLILGSMSIDGHFADTVACITSSHFASAEKEFRFPLGYGNQRPESSSWTVTGSGAFILGRKSNPNSLAKITAATIGTIEDFGMKDAMNMGACMAPAAAALIETNLKDYGRTPTDYDKIITGDLGQIGQKLLFDLLWQKGIDISKNHMDCGIEIFHSAKQGTHAGGSGCGCCAVTLAAFLLKQIKEGTWRRILFVPTGALLSKTSSQEGMTIPGVAHGVVIEHIDSL